MADAATINRINFILAPHLFVLRRATRKSLAKRLSLFSHGYFSELLLHWGNATKLTMSKKTLILFTYGLSLLVNWQGLGLVPTLPADYSTTPWLWWAYYLCAFLPAGGVASVILRRSEARHRFALPALALNTWLLALGLALFWRSGLGLILAGPLLLILPVSYVSATLVPIVLGGVSLLAGMVWGKLSRRLFRGSREE
jgi:hypothetical protein